MVTPAFPRSIFPRRLGAGPIALDLDTTLPKLTIDNVQIQQVLVNLVRNAFDAIDEAGDQCSRNVTISTSRSAKDRLEIAVREHGTFDQSLDRRRARRAALGRFAG